MESIVYRVDGELPRNHRAEFKVYSHGINEVMPPGIQDRPRGSEDWLFIYFNDPVQVRLKNGIQNVDGGTLVIWSPDQGHYYGNPEASWCHSWLQCTGTSISSLLDQSGFACNEAISMRHPLLVQKYLMRIFTEVSSHPVPNDQILQNGFHNWILETARIVQGQSDGSSPLPPESLQSVKQYMDSHVEEHLSLRELAEKSHLSANYFSMLFRKYYGAAPMDYCIQRRMEYAAFLLEVPSWTITEIAERIGYNDLYQFSRMFKKRFGISPSLYRKKHSKQETAQTVRPYYTKLI